MAPEVLQRKLEHLAQYLKDLEPFRGCSFEAYQTHHYTVDRLLELIVTVAIDITYHLLAEQGEPPPASYAAGFVRAGELGILPPELAASLGRAAGLRNILAHGYADIRPTDVHGSIDQALRDFPQFIAVLSQGRT